MVEIKKLYTCRFSQEELQQKNAIWKVLCSSYFQKYIGPEDVVLDLGAGYGEFINNIRCQIKYALEANVDIKKFVNKDVLVYQKLSTDLSCFQDMSIDVVFASNFFEHLKDKKELAVTLKEVYRTLKNGGKLLILQPNINFLAKEYWDFFDHHIPLSHKTMVEALVSHDFRIRQVIPKFLPFTTKSRFPKYTWLVRLYLRFKLLQFIFGKQMFIVAEKIEI